VGNIKYFIVFGLKVHYIGEIVRKCMLQNVKMYKKNVKIVCDMFFIIFVRFLPSASAKLLLKAWGAIHQCLRIILNLDSYRDSKPAKNRFLKLRIHS
jgi:hypothetical protein